MSLVDNAKVPEPCRPKMSEGTLEGRVPHGDVWPRLAQLLHVDWPIIWVLKLPEHVHQLAAVYHCEEAVLPVNDGIDGVPRLPQELIDSPDGFLAVQHTDDHGGHVLGNQALENEAMVLTQRVFDESHTGVPSQHDAVNLRGDLVGDDFAHHDGDNDGHQQLHTVRDLQENDRQADGQAAVARHDASGAHHCVDGRAHLESHPKQKLACSSSQTRSSQDVGNEKAAGHGRPVGEQGEDEDNGKAQKKTGNPELDAEPRSMAEQCSDDHAFGLQKYESRLGVRAFWTDKAVYSARLVANVDELPSRGLHLPASKPDRQPEADGCGEHSHEHNLQDALPSAGF
mmetsp:Transcript_14387/g.31493  ORF Transcript_14387/g.31493 Transcript_14387/m.31493 type:complete len:341 (-) Transcript_14387:407-1429(-)